MTGYWRSVLFRRLLSQPVLWAVVYLGAIPFFAWRFYTLPDNSFYYSSARHDAEVAAYADEILDALHSEIVRTAEGVTGSTVIRYGDWRFDWANTEFYDLEAQPGGRASFRSTFVFRNAADPDTVLKQVQFVRLTTTMDLWGAAELLGERVRYINVDLETGGPLAIPPEHLFGIWPERVEAPWEFFFPMPVSSHVALQKFRSAALGRATHVPGGFPRMIYLSAVTITTLGYGDIVPTTRRARSLIAAESILGVVLAGLFVSSVAIRVARAAGAGSRPSPN